MVLARIFCDNDLSATSGGPRPAYREMMRAVARGEVASITVWHLSRLWRNRRERAEGIELCKKHGVSVFCVKGPELDMSTAYGRGVAGLLGEVDTLEVEIKSERQQRALLQAVQEGTPPSGKRCFGYGHDGIGVIEAEAEAIRAAHRAFQAGVSIKQIAREWNAAGLWTPTPDMDENGRLIRGARKGQAARAGGKQWGHSSVRALLANPRYAGLRVYDGTVYPGEWPGIVDEQVWRASVALLTRPGRGHGKSNARKWIGSGLFLCGRCTPEREPRQLPEAVYPMTSTYRKTTAGNRRVYKCPSCHMSRLAEEIDDHVLDVLGERLSRADAVDLLVDDDRPDYAQLQDQAQALRLRIREAADLWEDGDLTKAEYKERKARLQSKLTKVEAAMTDTARSPILAEVINAPDVRDHIAHMGLDRQRAMIDAVCVIVLARTRPGRRDFDPASVRFYPR